MDLITKFLEWVASNISIIISIALPILLSWYFNRTKLQAETKKINADEQFSVTKSSEKIINFYDDAFDEQKKVIDSLKARLEKLEKCESDKNDLLKEIKELKEYNVRLLKVVDFFILNFSKEHPDVVLQAKEMLEGSK